MLNCRQKAKNHTMTDGQWCRSGLLSVSRLMASCSRNRMSFWWSVGSVLGSTLRLQSARHTSSGGNSNERLLRKGARRHNYSLPVLPQAVLEALLDDNAGLQRENRRLRAELAAAGQSMNRLKRETKERAAYADELKAEIQRRRGVVMRNKTLTQIAGEE